MKQVLVFDKSKPDIGLLTRKPKIGPEHKLVRRFTDFFTNSFKSKSTRLAIFHEPQLDSGFPDIVFVEFSPGVIDKWNDRRSSSQPMDIRILHYLYLVKGADSAFIERTLGINGRILLPSLERLLDSQLIYRKSGQWRTYSLTNIFAIRNIVAVEAKMNGWQSVFEQARINKWFASESYILSPIIQPNAKTLKTSNKLGIGIYTCNSDGVTKISESDRGSLPSCYASWMFNEWIGRSLESGYHS